jgi:alkylated DNA repair dioxygenase AlkB
MSPVHAVSDPPPGLAYLPDFLDAAEEAELIAQLEGLPFQAVVMRGVAARRSVVHYGFDYGYESWALTPGPAVPAFLHPVRTRVATLLDAPSAALAQVLVTRYPPGAGIGWHRDASMFGPRVAGISLASDTELRLRRRTPAGWARWRQPLAPRSVYVLGGAARTIWQHGLPPVLGLRYSITFRTVRPVALRAARPSRVTRRVAHAKR